MRETALIIEAGEAEAAVHDYRARHDPVARRGVPGHVTVLFPFVPPDLFDDTTLDTLAAVVQETSVFDYDLVAVEEFPGAVWLRPDPDQPFRDLTRRIWTAFPDYPPYGGRFPDSQPHLTVGISGGDHDHSKLLEVIRAEIGPRLPMRCSAQVVSVFMSNEEGFWHRQHQLRFCD